MKTLALRTAIATLIKVTAVFAAVTFIASPAGAEDESEKSPVKAKVVAHDQAISAGQIVRLKVEFEIAAGTHIYYKEPGETGLPTRVELVAPESFSLTDLEWQPPHEFVSDDIRARGYENQTTIVALIKAPDNLKPGEPVEIRLQTSWLACDANGCTPGDAELSITLPVAVAAANASGQTQGGGRSMSLLWALLLAFGGGILLNLMPCVLPVISLKIFGFVKQGGQDRRRIFKLGLAYSAGTVVTFLLLALVVIFTQQAGYTVGWGFQFQQPLFVLSMITLVTVMSLSLFGVFYLQVSAGNNGLERQAQSEGLFGAFCKGVSATLLSTPCTAPLLGTAMGFAFSQPWWCVLFIFATVGFGLASPYLLLSWQPGWMRFLPKPGAWMEHFKQAMGFLMLATAIWLLSVLGRQTSLDAVFLTLAFLLVVSVGVWIVGHFAGPEQSRRRRTAIWILVLSASTMVFWFGVRPTLSHKRQTTPPAAWSVNGVHWELYSKTNLQKHLAAGKIVLIDFTADWCLTCKLNERVFSDQTVTAKMLATNTVVLKADWTNGDPEITKLLSEFGRSGVPLYVVYAPNNAGAPVILSEIITVATIVDTLETLAKGKQ